MKQLNFLFFLIAVSFLFFEFVPLTSAQNTALTLTILPGPITITSPSQIELGTLQASLSSAQTVRARIPNIAVADYRGSVEGWTAGFYASSLGVKGESVLKRKTNSGTNSTADASDITIQGVYNGLNSQGNSQDAFIITINTVNGQPPRPAVITVQKPDGTNSSLAIANNAVSFNGLTVNFAVGTRTYAENDKFAITVDHFAPSAISVQTENLIASGNPMYDVTANPNVRRDNFSRIDALANAGGGMGSYLFDDVISWNIHANPLPGAYQSVLTYMVQ